MDERVPEVFLTPLTVTDGVVQIDFEEKKTTSPHSVDPFAKELTSEETVMTWEWSKRKKRTREYEMKEIVKKKEFERKKKSERKKYEREEWKKKKKKFGKEG